MKIKRGTARRLGLRQPDRPRLDIVGAYMTWFDEALRFFEQHPHPGRPK